jgi:hypothetical protein
VIVDIEVTLCYNNEYIFMMNKEARYERTSRKYHKARDA